MNYIILFELKEYLCIILLFSCSILIFATKTCCFFLSTKMKIGSVRDFSKVAILKTKLLAGNDHMIDIFTSGEDMENISPCIFSIFTVNYIYNKHLYRFHVS